MDVEKVAQIYDELLGIRDQSTCNRRQVASALVLPDGNYWRSVNGSFLDPCTEKGPDYCKRDKENTGLEYVTCPSPCAEGRLIMSAEISDIPLRGGTIITTDFPCPRCRDLIITYGIRQLIFESFKEETPRTQDDYSSAVLTTHGVSVLRVIPKFYLGERLSVDLRPHRRHEALEILARGYKPSDHYYTMTLLDPKFRAEMESVLREPRRTVLIPRESADVVLRFIE